MTGAPATSRAARAARSAAPALADDLISDLGGVREALRLLARGDGTAEERRALARDGVRFARAALRALAQLRAEGTPRPEVAARRAELAREGDCGELPPQAAHAARVVPLGRVRRGR